jgi:hypothetical protein
VVVPADPRVRNLVCELRLELLLDRREMPHVRDACR